MTEARQAKQITIADIDQIIEGIEHFIVGIGDPHDLTDIWQPYIDKLVALKPLLTALSSPSPQPEDRIDATCDNDWGLRCSDLWPTTPASWCHGCCFDCIKRMGLAERSSPSEPGDRAFIEDKYSTGRRWFRSGDHECPYEPSSLAGRWWQRGHDHAKADEALTQAEAQCAAQQALLSRIAHETRGAPSQILYYDGQFYKVITTGLADEAEALLSSPLQPPKGAP